MLAETPDAVRFAHALIREALYERTLAPRKRRWHRRAAEVLAELPDPDPDLIAGHFRQAHDERALGWLLLAGGRGEAAHAIPQACARYAAAVALLAPRPGTARERAWLLYHMGALQAGIALDAAEAALALAAPLADAAGDRRLGAAILAVRGLGDCHRGAIRRGIAAMRAALAARPEASAPEHASLPLLGPRLARLVEAPGIIEQLALWLANTGEYAAVERLVRRTGVDAPGGPDPNSADVALASARALAARGAPEAARRAFVAARARYAASHKPAQVGAALLDEVRYIALPYLADRPGEREALLGEALRLLGVLRPVFAAVEALAGIEGAFHAPVLHLAGRWAEASECAETTRDTARALRTVNVFTSQATAVLGQIAAARGDGASLRALLAEALPAGPATTPGDQHFLTAVTLQRLAADLALDIGDPAAARSWLDAHERWITWSGSVLGRAEGALGWAAYHRTAGDIPAARAHAERALASATAPRQPLALLAALRALGELDAIDGRHAAGRAHLAAALVLADACAAPYERALTLLVVAELDAVTGDRDGAAVALAEARAVFAPLWARPALARADALAARLPGVETPPPIVTVPPDRADLTAREVAVLRLVAVGLTNRAIGAQLGVSSRTVGAHLNHIFGKLGVATRTAAAREAFRRGLACADPTDPPRTPNDR